MLGDEADASSVELTRRAIGTFSLTIQASDLICRGNDDLRFQGNYDYHAHAQVLTGGADPLGSQGYASELRHPLSSQTRPAEPKARGRFCL